MENTEATQTDTSETVEARMRAMIAEMDAEEMAAELEAEKNGERVR